MENIYNLIQARKILNDLYKELGDDIQWLSEQDDDTKAELANSLIDTRAHLVQVIDKLTTAESSLRRYSNKRSEQDE